MALNVDAAQDSFSEGLKYAKKAPKKKKKSGAKASTSMLKYKKHMDKTITPVLKDMTREIFKDKPQDVISYMIEHLKEVQKMDQNSLGLKEQPTTIPQMRERIAALEAELRTANQKIGDLQQSAAAQPGPATPAPTPAAALVPSSANLGVAKAEITFLRARAQVVNLRAGVKKNNLRSARAQIAALRAVVATGAAPPMDISAAKAEVVKLRAAVFGNTKAEVVELRAQVRKVAAVRVKIVGLRAQLRGDELAAAKAEIVQMRASAVTIKKSTAGK